MKIYIFLSLMCLPFIVNAQFIKADLQVAGLTCSMCSRAVDKQLQSLDFIDSVGINLEQALFIIYFKPNKMVDINTIKIKVEDAGFSVASLNMYYKFEQQKIDEHFHLKYAQTLIHFMDVKPQIISGIRAFKIIGKGFLLDKAWRKFESKTIKHSHGELDKTNEIKTIIHAIL